LLPLKVVTVDVIIGFLDPIWWMVTGKDGCSGVSSGSDTVSVLIPKGVLIGVGILL
jgi:hypothetical protein